MTPDVQKFGRLIAGWDPITKRGAICPACNKGGGYLVGESGDERHLRCWQDPQEKKVKVDPGPRFFDPFRPSPDDDVVSSSCCEASLELASFGWRCSACRRHIPA